MTPGRALRDVLTARRRERGVPADDRSWDQLPAEDRADCEAAAQAVLKTRLHDDLDIALDKIAAVTAERDALKDVAERTADDRDAWLKTAGRWRHAATDLAALRQALTDLAAEWRRQAADDRDEATQLGKRGLSDVARAPRRAAAVRENHAAALRAALRKLVTP
jgi:hypothetical protein